MLVIACSHRVSSVNTTADKTKQFCLVSTQFWWVLSCLYQVSILQLFSLKYTEDYWKLGNWKLGRDKTKLFSAVVFTRPTQTVSGVNKLRVPCRWGMAWHRATSHWSVCLNEDTYAELSWSFCVIFLSKCMASNWVLCNPVSLRWCQYQCNRLPG